jgi:hypothetical protein
MFTRPDDLDDATLIGQLSDHWNISVDDIEYLAVGFGSHHWRAIASGQSWFVTVDDLDVKLRDRADSRHQAFVRLQSALDTARLLHDRGLAFVVAPIPAVDGSVVRRTGDHFAIAVYPHIDGRTHTWGPYESHRDRSAVLQRLIAVHGATADASAPARLDDFSIQNRDDLEQSIAGVPSDTGPFAHPANALLAQHARVLTRLLVEYDHLADEARRAGHRNVVTHGEPHMGNTMVTEQGWLLVDWDTALLAPPERDLWMVAAGDRSIIDLYTASTGREVLDRALEMYRLAWDLNDMSVYAALFRRPHTDTRDARESFDNLMRLLDGLDQRHTGSTDTI